METRKLHLPRNPTNNSFTHTFYPILYQTWTFSTKWSNNSWLLPCLPFPFLLDHLLYQTVRRNTNLLLLFFRHGVAKNITPCGIKQTALRFNNFCVHYQSNLLSQLNHTNIIQKDVIAFSYFNLILFNILLLVKTIIWPCLQRRHQFSIPSTLSLTAFVLVCKPGRWTVMFFCLVVT